VSTGWSTECLAEQSSRQLPGRRGRLPMVGCPGRAVLAALMCLSMAATEHLAAAGVFVSGFGSARRAALPAEADRCAPARPESTWPEGVALIRFCVEPPDRPGRRGGDGYRHILAAAGSVAAGAGPGASLSGSSHQAALCGVRSLVSGRWGRICFWRPSGSSPERWTIPQIRPTGPPKA